MPIRWVKNIFAYKNKFKNAFLPFLIEFVNPLTPSRESCSDWAENFSVASFNYLKNIMFYALIFYLALLKSY
jgi:hypothetical protein